MHTINRIINDRPLKINKSVCYQTDNYLFIKWEMG